ncbi:MAG: sensor domain-containing diguanylate cyclase [Mycobacteriales bacterium]
MVVWRLLGVTGLGAVALFAVLSEGPAAGYYFGTAAMLLAILGGLLARDRDRADLAWVLLFTGLFAFTTRAALGYLYPSPAVATAQIALITVGYAACVAAILRLIALRTDLRDVDGVIDVLMLTAAIAVALWEFVARRHLGDGAALGSSVALIAYPLLQGFAFAVSVRFMFWGTWRLPSAWLLFGGAGFVFAGNVSYIVSQDVVSVGVPSRGTGALWLMAMLLFSLAASHPSRDELSRATMPSMSKVPYARLVVVAGALIAAPAIVFSHAREYSSGMIPAVGSIILSVLIVARLVRVVIEREAARTLVGVRADQQLALVGLGERALAGSELARLFDEASVAIARTVGADFVGVFEPAGAETLILRAAVGWELAQSSRSTVSTAEPFFGVPLLAGAPGHLDRDRQAAGSRRCPLLIDSGATSGVSVTIGTPAQRYGVLAIASRAARRFDADDVTFLRAVANVLTAAIERARTDDEVKQAALHDPLTGLPNRVLLLDRLESALSRASRAGGRVAVMFVDLDGFKQVNDTFGHRAGDQLLVAVSRRLHATLRSEDTLARLAGDEFVIICERIDDLATIAGVASRIVMTLNEPFVLDDGTAQNSGSVGISVAAGLGDDVDRLLREADAAMYRAKKAGKSRYEFAADEWTDAQLSPG